ncbi:unnamed protein product [Adineta steineri]|uniref:Uncharacterized protein n=1 Tax=Adineta steineri TaxID=433720 RepID=A0A813R679_9BILA|nr:unnamed protein product [Adineta steineri]CAF3541713.1 unnamed protein product [Adineta steineri]
MGLKTGCTPTESFLASSLACFYNLSCINLIYNQLNYSDNIPSVAIPLSTDKSRFSTNTPVIDLVNKVFIENWSTAINYSSYFDQCSPSLCSYTYTERVNLLYTVTLISGIYGGLSLILNWLCPIIIRLWFKIYECRKKRTNRIDPVSTDEMATSQETNTSVRHSNPSNATDYSTLVSTVSTNTSSILQRFVCCKVLPCVLITAAIIIPSVYLIGKGKNRTFPRSNTILTTTAVIDMFGFSTIDSTTAEPPCPIAFHPIVLYPGHIHLSSSPLAVADFNSDGHLDIAVIKRGERNIDLLFGNGNGNFQEPTKSSILSDNELTLVVKGNLNNDNYPDLVFANGANNDIGVLLGTRDGTFLAPMPYSIEVDGLLNSIIIGDFNNDGAADLIVTINTGNTIILLYGDNNGGFKAQKTIPNRNCTNKNLVVGDFNKDGQPDFISVSGSICVLLSNGKETFGPTIVIPVEFRFEPTSAIIGDFNHDNQLDFVFTERSYDNVMLFLGNGSDGTFHELKKFTTGIRAFPRSIVVGDFNNDGHQDFAVALGVANAVGVMFGNGKGNFTRPIEFLTGSFRKPAFIAIGDFNSDSRLDIVVTSETNLTMGILFSSCECCVFKPLNKRTLV